MAIQRPHYFDHQFLIERDFTLEQTYHLDMRRRLNKALYSAGIAEGLEVTKATANSVNVARGVAMDNTGREIVVDEQRNITVTAAAGARVFVTATYQESQTDPSTATGASGFTRVTENPTIVANTATPPSDGSVIVLAAFEMAAGPSVPGAVGVLLDGGVRQVIRSKGSVQGLVSLDNVSSPGGNIDLIPQGVIVITPDDANNRIIIGENHSGRTDNPHQTTAAQVGAFTSLAGVSNAGGNIDLVETNAITLKPEDANNRILIGESHSGRTDNPHQTTAAQVGAMALADYDLRRRGLTAFTFNEGNVTGAATTLNLGFQPEIIYMVGTVTSKVASGVTHSGGISAFAFVDSNGALVQRCFGFSVTRNSATDWLTRSTLGANICNASIIDSTGADAKRGENLIVNITALSATGLTVTLSRVLVTGFSPLLDFALSLQLMCMGKLPTS